MTAQEIINKAFVILGDEQKVFWTDLECLGYLNEGLVEISEAARYLRKKIYVTLDGSSSYTFPTDFIVLETAWDSSKEWDIKNYTYENKDKNYTILMDGMTTYKVNEPNDVTITLDYYHTQGAIEISNEIPLPSDIVDGIKYYILSKAFIKDIAPKDENKSDRYYAEYKKYEDKMRVRASKFYSTEVSKSSYQGF